MIAAGLVTAGETFLPDSLLLAVHLVVDATTNLQNAAGKQVPPTLFEKVEQSKLWAGFVQIIFVVPELVTHEESENAYPYKNI